MIVPDAEDNGTSNGGVAGWCLLTGSHAWCFRLTVLAGLVLLQCVPSCDGKWGLTLL